MFIQSQYAISDNYSVHAGKTQFNLSNLLPKDKHIFTILPIHFSRQKVFFSKFWIFKDD
jgi:hypothetical protein